MLKDILFIARKDLKYTLKGRETIFWVFVMPIVFFYFIGTITGGFTGGGAERVAVWQEGDGGFLAEQLVQRLEDQDYTIVRPDSLPAMKQWLRQVYLPDAFSDSVLAGNPVSVEFVNRSEDLRRDYHDIRVGRSVYTLLADVIVSGEGGSGPSEASIAELNAMPRALGLEVESAGERVVPPVGFEQAIPGILVMFTLLVMATSGAILLVIERRQGLLRRLASTPIPRLSIVLGKWCGKLAVGLVQIGFGMVVGTLIFKMNWGGDLPSVLLLMFFYGAMMAAFGMLLGSLARTEAQATAIGVIAANSLAALGGCWWPIEIAPDWMQKLQLFLPTGWAMDGLHKLVSFGAGPASVLPHILGMAATTLLLVLAATRRFRYE
jgi:ABC-2 type transport system permease protein